MTISCMYVILEMTVTFLPNLAKVSFSISDNKCLLLDEAHFTCNIPNFSDSSQNVGHLAEIETAILRVQTLSRCNLMRV